MLIGRATTLAAIALLASPVSARPAGCDALDGAAIIAEDGTYLGKIADEYDQKSIFNKYGTYGNPYAPKSIWNDYGQYGSEYSNKSARSEYTSTPPKIIVSGKVVGFLSRNKYKSGSIDPLILGVACYGYEPD
ncbi:MAG: hypothetical protein OJI67_08365 [Prosthecobacter sp.]|nr:hypothetical protein [Prosthecobacter sp.]